MFKHEWYKKKKKARQLFSMGMKQEKKIEHGMGKVDKVPSSKENIHELKWFFLIILKSRTTCKE